MATQPFEIGNITIGKPHLHSYESNAKQIGLSYKKREICRHVARMGEMRNANRFFVASVKVRGQWSDVHVKEDNISPLNTKRRVLYLRTQFVPRSKHFSSRL